MSDKYYMKQATKNVLYNLSVIVSNNRWGICIGIFAVTVWSSLGWLGSVAFA